ncbi:MAG: transposase [Lawsonibacter sp.]|nr:transposase [Lawsonibacter sp.]
MAKSKYESHVLPNLEKITAWAKAGATSKDIAAKLKVSYSTFRKYLDEGEKGDERYTALSEAFAQACEVPDDTIETALFNRAKGIEYEEKTFETKLDPKTGNHVEVCTKRVTKFIPPDPTSAMFWLTNRRPDRWSYKPQSGDGDDGDSSGVVLLAPVMENPGPPEGGDGDA